MFETGLFRSRLDWCVRNLATTGCPPSVPSGALGRGCLHAISWRLVLLYPPWRAMAQSAPVARLAVAKLLRARVVDIASVLGGPKRGDVQVLAAGQFSNTSQKAALIEQLASAPQGHAERLLVLPRATAAAIFGSQLASGLAAISADPEQRDAFLPLEQSLNDLGSDGKGSCARGGDSMRSDREGLGLVSKSTSADIVEMSTASALSLPSDWEAVASLPMGSVASSLHGGAVTDTLRRTPPASVLRRPAPLSPEVAHLFEAAESGSLDVLRRCLDEYARGDLDIAHPDHGGTCLHVAASLLSADVAAACVAELCARGASVNAQAANASTPLHWAAGSGNAAAVSELLRCGADPEALSYTWRSNVFGKGSGQTAAHWAAESGHHACVELLVQQGSALAPFLADERGNLPSDLATKEGHDEVAAVLEEAAQIEMVCLAVSTEATVHSTMAFEGSGRFVE